MTTNNQHANNFKRVACISTILVVISSVNTLTFTNNVNSKHAAIPQHRSIYSISSATTSWPLFSVSKKKEVDPLRKGKRASIHPVTINAISQALLQRSTGKISTAAPLELANAAGRIAVDAMEKRRNVLLADGDEDMTPEEWQTVCGRVVGVTTRLNDLEQMLCARVTNVEWIEKYDEYDSFGMLKSEYDGRAAANDIEKNVFEQIEINPLLRMNRAECLLALFLINVEAPTLEKLKMDAPGGSTVNFLEQDKLDVLKDD